ncbi:MAG: Hsp20/alpha crystallin family protein [Lachnospiraceae bacterium]|nr:Hsp20/alpha crystallin family protein [Lachnospiraceae bacterium]
MYDNDLFNQLSDAFHDMLDNLDKGLRDGVGDLKDMKKNVERNGLFGEKKQQRKTNYRAPFDRFKKNFSAANIENPFAKRKIHADVIRCDGTITIRAELPGYDKSKIHVDYRDSEIIIRADREMDDEPAEGETRRDYDRTSDRYYGKVERAFKVGKIDVTTVRANYNNGILTITCEAPDDGSAINID